MIAGAIIGAVAGLGSTIIGQIAAEKKARQQMEELNRQEGMWENYHNNSLGYSMDEINELGRMVNDSIRERNRTAENPISQHTVEGEAAIREQNAQDVSGFARSAVPTVIKEKADNENRYMAAKSDISSKKAGVAANQAQQITNAASQLTNSMINVAGKFADTKGSGKVGDAAAVATRAKVSDADANKAVVNDLVGGQTKALGSYNPDEGDYAPFKSMFT